MDRASFAAALQELALSPSEPMLDAFEAFEEALYRANEVMNLTRVPREECATRHFLDSLLLSPFLPVGSTVVDLGTGPGFPAWPLACARPDLAVTAVDSSGKMLGFLRRHPLENLRVIETRIEDWDVREAFQVVTGRAVAPLAAQLELSASLVAPEGMALPMRTPNDLESIQDFPADELGLALGEIHQVPLPGTDIVRCFPVFRKVAVTPRRYPRTWPEIKRKPLTREPQS